MSHSKWIPWYTINRMYAVHLYTVHVEHVYTVWLVLALKTCQQLYCLGYFRLVIPPYKHHGSLFSSLSCISIFGTLAIDGVHRQSNRGYWILGGLEQQRGLYPEIFSRSNPFSDVRHYSAPWRGSVESCPVYFQHRILCALIAAYNTVTKSVIHINVRLLQQLISSWMSVDNADSYVFRSGAGGEGLSFSGTPAVSNAEMNIIIM